MLRVLDRDPLYHNVNKKEALYILANTVEPGYMGQLGWAVGCPTFPGSTVVGMRVYVIIRVKTLPRSFQMPGYL